MGDIAFNFDHFASHDIKNNWYHYIWIMKYCQFILKTNKKWYIYNCVLFQFSIWKLRVQASKLLQKTKKENTNLWIYFICFRPKPYILDPVDPYNNVISQITNHYCRGSHVQAADREVMQQVFRLQRDAEQAFKSFE